MKRKKRKLNIKRIVLLVLIIVILVVVCFLAFNKTKESSSNKKVVKNIDTIEGYDYTLKENATKYYKGLFKELKNVLEADNVNEEKYAKLVGQMFVYDFFNLDNKISKNDVGGKQFVFKNYQNDFEKYAMDTMYKTVESNVYNNRKQQLPSIAKVSVGDLENTTFTYGNNTDDKAYALNFEIEYKEDLGYQTSGTLKLIHNDKRIDVASMGEKSTND